MTKKNTLIAALLATGALTASADSFTLKDVKTDFGICVDAGLTVTITDDKGQKHTYVSDGTFFFNDATDGPFQPGNTNEITVTTNTYIRNLYLDATGASDFKVGALSRLEVLNLSHINMAELDLAKVPELQTLILSNNDQLTHLNLTKQTKLRKLLVSGVKIEDLDLASANITDLWIDNARLSGTLDLSKQNHLRCLNVSANLDGHLDHVLLSGTTAAKAALEYVDLSHNYLFYDSFPTVFDKQKQTYTAINNLGEQRPFHYVDYFTPGEQYDLTDLIRYNAWGAAITPKVELYRMTKRGDYTPNAENLLVEGTDFTKVGSYKYTFLTEQPSIFLRVQSDLYPGLTLVTEPFAITSDPSGITPVLTNTESTAPAYDLQGRALSPETPGTHPANLRIQNGRKTIKH